MREKILDFYAAIFAKPAFYRWNKFLYHTSLKGLGVLNYKNDQQSGEENFLKNYLKKYDSPIVFDVGANEGRYSQMVLECNPEASLFSFEPHPNTFQKLVLRLQQLSKNVVLINKAVGKNKDVLKLYDYLENDGSSHASLYSDVISSIHNKETVTHEVDVIDLKSLLEENSIERIDLLKIDTEGNELNVLLGLETEFLNQKVGAIHFEFNEMNIISHSSFKNFWDLLSNFNLNRLLPNGKMLRIEKYSPIDCEIYAYQNIVAFRK